MNERKKCLVICPFGAEDSEIRKWSDFTLNYIIKDTVKKLGYKAERADHFNKPGEITKQVIEQLIYADLVIADLTDYNPNVFYELAIRHFSKKPCLQVIKFDQKIPFDVFGLRTVFIGRDHEQVIKAIKELTSQIKSIENGEFEANNPITSVHSYELMQYGLKDAKKGMVDNVIEELRKYVLKTNAMEGNKVKCEIKIEIVTSTV